jgi:pyruvate kinase
MKFPDPLPSKGYSVKPAVLPDLRKMFGRTDTTFRKTKIVATIGESSSSYESIRDLARAGVDLFRLSDRFTRINSRNQTLLEKIRKASAETEKKLGIMLHLKECDIRMRI